MEGWVVGKELAVMNLIKKEREKNLTKILALNQSISAHPNTEGEIERELEEHPCLIFCGMITRLILLLHLCFKPWHYFYMYEVTFTFKFQI